ncbi:MAG TPA: undecaprenyl-phosphate glucose phosphotransferase [Thermoanaerobaculaceae bacterium]|nr:undecaprenyl-phosphate glucose phosphotransferase [Thermoanaerobaculaceae bacterium]
MIGEKLRINRTVLVVVDLAATYLALLLAYHLRFSVEVYPVTKGVPPFAPYMALFPIITLIWPVVFYFRGLLQGKPQRSRVEEAFSVTIAVVVATFVLNAGLAFYRDFTYSRLVLAIFVLLDVVLVVAGRLVFWSAMAQLWASSRHRRRALIAGAGELGRMVAEKLAQHRELGLDVVGFLDDDPGKANARFEGLPVLGTTDQLAEVVQREGVDQLYVALPLGAQHKTVRLLKLAEPLLLAVRVVPDLLQYYALRAGVEDLDGIPVINLTQIPLAGWNTFLKRLVDLLLGSLALLVSSPVLAAIALVVWLEDRGPVFYRQLRMGLDGKPFRIVKFRTMVPDAEQETGPRFAVPNDPRTTRVGTWLRRLSLDELPQLINVVRGEMSLVGPRPERPEFVARFRERYPEYMSRHRVRAGITGWAQVHDLRGQSSIRKRIAYDLYYIDNWTLALDFKIMWLTALRFWRHRHAY